MQHKLPLPTLHLVESDTKILPERAIHKLCPAIRTGHPHQGGTIIGHVAEAVFTLDQRFRGTLAPGNVFHLDHGQWNAVGLRYQRDSHPRPYQISVAVNVPLLILHAFVRVPH